MKINGLAFSVVIFLISVRAEWSNEGTYWTFILFHWIIFLLWIESFLARPGDGKEFVYSPVGINTTLHCAMINTHLHWSVDEEPYDGPDPDLVSRGIFIRTSSNGITTSYMTVFGNQTINSNVSTCCLYFERLIIKGRSCTTLILYGMLIVIITSTHSIIIKF